MPRHIHQEYTVLAPIQEVFQSLITPSSIRSWWQVSRAIVLPEEGGTYALAWGEDEDDPDYISVSTIKHLDPPREILFTDFKYFSRGGKLPFEPQLDLRFRLQEKGRNTVVQVEQTGFPDEEVADDFYRSCIAGWKEVMQAFQETLKRK